MSKAMELLRKLAATRKPREADPTAFEDRLSKLGSVRPVSVARSVLFRTERSHPAA